MTKANDLANEHVEQYERDYDNDAPPFKWLLIALPLLALLFVLLAPLLFCAYDTAFGQGSDTAYPLLETGYADPPNPYRQNLGAVWPDDEQQMTDEQRLAFVNLTGIQIPLATVETLANTPIIRCEAFCFETGMVWPTELIAWSDEQAFGNFPVIAVYKNAVFSDYYMIAVFSTYALGQDDNPHPRGYYWVRIDEFRAVFPEIEYQEE
jgi:hypothetical protein